MIDELHSTHAADLKLLEKRLKIDQVMALSLLLPVRLCDKLCLSVCLCMCVSALLSNCEQILVIFAGSVARLGSRLVKFQDQDQNQDLMKSVQLN